MKKNMVLEGIKNTMKISTEVLSRLTQLEKDIEKHIDIVKSGEMKLLDEIENIRDMSKRVHNDLQVYKTLPVYTSDDL